MIVVFRYTRIYFDMFVGESTIWTEKQIFWTQQDVCCCYSCTLVVSHRRNAGSKAMAKAPVSFRLGCSSPYICRKCWRSCRRKCTELSSRLNASRWVFWGSPDAYRLLDGRGSETPGPLVDALGESDLSLGGAADHMVWNMGENCWGSQILSLQSSRHFDFLRSHNDGRVDNWFYVLFGQLDVRMESKWR